MSQPNKADPKSAHFILKVLLKFYCLVAAREHSMDKGGYNMDTRQYKMVIVLYNVGRGGTKTQVAYGFYGYKPSKIAMVQFGGGMN